jgi:hypothetical protein
MNSIEDIYNQAINHRGSMKIPMNFGDSVINYGVKIQKFISKTEILNCSRNGDYFQECSEDEYQLFFIHGWIKGGLRLSMMNYKRKLDIIEISIRNESNTRKNDKHIKKLKANRENLLIKYSKRKKQLNKIQLNESKIKHL